MKQNPIQSTVPFDTDGVHHGFLKLPHSRDDSAWGSVMIPICVIRRGHGKCALLTGANHGDEYEGPVALQQLAHTLSASSVSGCVIIIPAMNFPAFQAGTRTSPIDGINLNRIFPGKPDGSVTEKIADYFERTLIPMADVVVDIHAGGKTLDFLPFACAHMLDKQTLQAECVAVMQAFNAPYSLMLLEIDNVGMFDSAVEAQGKIFISTELGGGGTATATSIAIARKGLRNVLAHVGILDEPLQTAPSTMLHMPDERCFVFSEHQGLLEPMVDLGATIAADTPLARVWPMDRTGVSPVEYRAHLSGILCARHFPGLIKPGDCMALIAQTTAEEHVDHVRSH